MKIILNFYRQKNYGGGDRNRTDDPRMSSRRALPLRLTPPTKLTQLTKKALPRQDFLCRHPKQHNQQVKLYDLLPLFSQKVKFMSRGKQLFRRNKEMASLQAMPSLGANSRRSLLKGTPPHVSNTNNLTPHMAESSARDSAVSKIIKTWSASLSSFFPEFWARLYFGRAKYQGSRHVITNTIRLLHCKYIEICRIGIIF